MTRKVFKPATYVVGAILGALAAVARMSGMDHDDATWVLLCAIFLLLLGRDE